MDEIEKLIVSLIKNDTTIQTLLGGSGSDYRVYPDIPNSSETFPCIVYTIITSVENTVPSSTQESAFFIKIYTKTSRENLEQITKEVRRIFKYKVNGTPRVYWTKKTAEQNLDETERLLFSKVLRYSIWSKIA